MVDQRLRELSQFTGSQYWYRHPLFSRQLYTDGVRYVADSVQAYWLIEKIFALQSHAALRAQNFQLWQLVVRDGGSATLAIEDGNGTCVYRESLTFTDFPVPGIQLYFVNQVLLLPSEY